MRISFRPSPAAVLAFIALMVALGGTALAATGQLVNITDPTTTANKAKVDATGALKVGDGAGPLTVDGTVLDREAAPNTWFRSRGSTGSFCTPVYSPPAGKSAVVKTLATNVLTLTSPGNGTYVGYYVGTDCSGFYFYDINPAAIGPVTTPFEPGIAIPAGQTLWVQTNNVLVESYATGYTLPSSAVPATATQAESHGIAPQGAD
jgi:hypothetical protein